MKLTISTILVAALASTAVAAPTKRSVIGDIGTTVSELNTAVTSDVKSINSLLASVTVVVNSLIATVNSDLEDVQTAFNTATNEIVSETYNAVTAITAADVADLENDVAIVDSVVKSLESTTEGLLNGVLASSETLINSELAAAIAAVQPFVGPLTTYINALTCADCSTGVLSNLKSAAAQLTADAKTLSTIVL